MEYGAVRFAGTSGWGVKCQPHVSLRLKRVFAKVAAGSHGEHFISDTAENARDLAWFLERYPMVVAAKDAVRLERLANEHRERQAVSERLLSGAQPPPQFELAVPLREYQRVAVAMALEMKGLLIADELGLGKTAEAIGIFSDPRTLPAIVVTQTHLTLQWQREIARFAPKLRTHVLKSGKPYPMTLDGARVDSCQQSLPSASPDVIIANYHKLSGWADTLSGYVKSAVFDECQELRIPVSQKYQAAIHIARSADFVVGATGTPIYNNGSELHSVLDVIRPDALGTREEFVREWCSGGNDGRERVRDPKALGLHVRDMGLMLRRTRVDVGRELPPMQRIIHHVEADLEALDRVSEGCRELALFILGRGDSPLKLDGEAKKGERMLASEELSNQLRQATGIAKAPYVAEFVRMLVESDEKVVLFGWHRSVYDIWLDRLKDLSPALYTGSETAKQKDESRQRFIEGDARILIMSLRSGAGLDGLQDVCRTVCIGELDWAYGVLEQCEGRVERDGQKHPVVAYYPVADTGSDPIVLDVLGIKRDQLTGVRDPNAPLVERLQADGDRIKRLAESYLAQRTDRKESST